MKKLMLPALLAFLSTLNLQLSTARAQGTAFTYQGRLQNNGAPATGIYDLRFTIYDSTNVPGNLIAGPVTNSAVSVTNGLFTTAVDFGNVFNGASNWLQIAVSTNGANAFSTLLPRQQLTPVPYAEFASSVSGLTIQPNGTSPNVVLGFSGNSVVGGVVGATIGGGGASGDINFVSGSFGTVNGGIENQVTGSSGTVSGGQLNEAGTNSTVSGGSGNHATGFGAVVAGGGTDGTSFSGNTASGNASVVGGGLGNQATNTYATVGGGYQNVASGFGAFVGGGGHGPVIAEGNTASGIVAVVAGGLGNQATNSVTVVGGGFQNVAGGIGSIVGGGQGNVASGDGSAVGGGYYNQASGSGAYVGGGGFDGSQALGNTASGSASVVGGGLGNLASGNYATVPGGTANTVTANFATVGGGANNTNSGFAATVSGGEANIASGGDATVAGGDNNNASGIAATVSGGDNNTASGNYSFAAGFDAQATNNGAFVWADSLFGNFYSTNNNSFNVRAQGGARFVTSGAGMTIDGQSVLTTGSSSLGLTIQQNATSPNLILGYSGNYVAAGIFGATIGGGGENYASNSVSGYFGTVSGGEVNQVTGSFGTVGGGQENIAETNATVSGGSANHATGSGAFVGGGGTDGSTFSGNTASGNASVVAGGMRNTASGNYATVPGGTNNVAGGLYSFAAGQQAHAMNQGSFVWADSQNAAFTSTENDQFLIRAQGGVGINASDPTENLTIGGVTDYNTGLRLTGSTINGTGMAIQNTATGGHKYDLISGGSTSIEGAGAFVLFDETAFRFDLTVATNGDVGIGTSSPTNNLQVAGGVTASEVKVNNGQFYVAAGDSPVRIVRGYVNAAGTILSGSGYTVTHTAGSGIYDIRFTTQFTDSPAFTVTSLYPVNVGIVGIATTDVEIQMNVGDQFFSFIAVGGR